MNKYHVYDNYLKEFPDEKGYFGEFGGYVYIMDEDTLYGARGRSKPKLLIERD